MKNYIKFTLLFLVIISLNLNGCSSLSKSEITDEQINREAEKSYSEIKAKSKISNNKKWTEMVQRVAARIAKSSGENFNWEVILIEDPQHNAWCMPGGKMAVYTGILPVLKTEAALAAVMGHEVAHATLRHGKKAYARAINEQMTGMILIGAAAVGGEILCKSEDCKKLAQVGGAAAGMAYTFFNRKFSRQDEVSADEIGQIYMAKAGYDPKESIELWKRMSAASGGSKPPEWMSTHPSEQNRQQKLGQWLSRAEKIYNQNPTQYGLGESL